MKISIVLFNRVFFNHTRKDIYRWGPNSTFSVHFSCLWQTLISNFFISHTANFNHANIWVTFPRTGTTVKMWYFFEAQLWPNSLKFWRDFVRCILKMVSFWSSLACFFYLAIFTVFTPNRRFLASFEVGISLPVSKRVQLDLNQCAHLLVNWVNGSTNRVLDELERDQKKKII